MAGVGLGHVGTSGPPTGRPTYRAAELRDLAGPARLLRLSPVPMRRKPSGSSAAMRSLLR